MGQDFHAKSETITFEVGEQQKTFSVNLVDDSIQEMDETFSVVLSDPSQGPSLADDTAEGAIIDDEQPMVASVSRTYSIVDEGQAGVVSFMVTLSHATTTASERRPAVDWQAVAGTATEGEDYQAAEGRLIFPVGMTSGSVQVDLIDDNLFEGELETFSVELIEQGRRLLTLSPTDASYEVSIRDNEILTAAITSNAEYVAEGGEAVFTVKLAGGVTTEDVQITFETGGDAQAGDDYGPPTGNIIFPPGNTTGSAGSLTIPRGPVFADHRVPGLHGHRRRRRRRDPGSAALHGLRRVEGQWERGLDNPEQGLHEHPGRRFLDRVDRGDPHGHRGRRRDLHYHPVHRKRGNGDGGLADQPGGRHPGSGRDRRTGQGLHGRLRGPGHPGGRHVPGLSRCRPPRTPWWRTLRPFVVTVEEATQGTGTPPELVLLGADSTTGTITDDDTAPNGLIMSVSPPMLTEASGSVDIPVTVTLDGTAQFTTDIPVTIEFVNRPNVLTNATLGEDYTANTVNTVILAGSSSVTATITITPVEDSIAEDDEIARLVAQVDGAHGVGTGWG